MSAERRPLTRPDLLLLVLNTVVGAGVVALPARAYAAAGDLVFLALAVAALAAGLIALVFARLAARFPGPGGPYLYARSTLGSNAGWAVASCLVPTRVLATAVSLNVLSAALRPWTGSTVATGLTLVTALACTALAFRSVTTPVRFGNLLGAGKLALLSAVAVGGVWLSATIGPGVGQEPGPDAAFGPAVLLWFYAFTGFESPTILAAEARTPRRDLPIALVAGVSVAALLYAMLLWTALAFTPDLARSDAPLAAAVGRVAPSLLAPASLLFGLLVLASLPSQFAVPARLLSSIAGDASALRAFRAEPDGVSGRAVLACGAVAAALHTVDLSALVILSALVRLGSYAVCSAGLARTAFAPARRSTRDGAVGAIGVCTATVLLLLAFAPAA